MEKNNNKNYFHSITILRLGEIMKVAKEEFYGANKNLGY